MTAKFQDYVIKDGIFLGQFEEMYQKFDDPWLQSSEKVVLESRRIIAKNWVKKIARTSDVRACEIGCGFGFFTSDLVKSGLQCVGIDVSATAIERAKVIQECGEFYVSRFEDFDFYKSRRINVFLMIEVTWYVLNYLEDFVKFLRAHRELTSEPVYLIHLLTTYSGGDQKYGREYFTDAKGIRDYFDLDYIEYGTVGSKAVGLGSTEGTYFVAKI